MTVYDLRQGSHKGLQIVLGVDNPLVKMLKALNFKPYYCNMH
jgi:hypothetical protein